MNQYADTQAVAAREPAIHAKLEALAASLELLEKSIINLGGRLELVSSPPLPAQAGKDGPSPAEPCPLADRIQSRIRKVEQMRSWVDEMTARLEI